MKRLFYNFLIIIYAVVAVIVTVCLLSFNDFRVSEIGDYSLVLVDKNNTVDGFNKGDLVIVEKGEDFAEGEKVLYYSTSRSRVDILEGVVKSKEEVTSKQTTYSVDENKLISSDYILGAKENVKIIPNLGTALNVLESKWGFLFLIVFPSLVAFIYEVITVIYEIKKSKD